MPDSTQVKITILERAIKKINAQLKNGDNILPKKYLLLDLIDCHRTLAKIINLESR